MTQCGWEGVYPKVCCPTGQGSNGNSNNQAPTISPVVFPASNQVTKVDEIQRPKVSEQSLIPNIGECGIGTTDRIVGGTRTELDEFPWMALLKYSKGNEKG